MNAIPDALVAGAEAFKQALVAIDTHVEVTPLEAEEFDFLDSAHIVMRAFFKLDDEGQTGFLIALADYLTMLKGAGTPYDDFEVFGLRKWVDAVNGPAPGVSGEGEA